MRSKLVDLEPIWIAGPAHREAGSNVHREFDLQLETLINDPKVESLLRRYLGYQYRLYSQTTTYSTAVESIRFQDIRAAVGDTASTMDLLTYYIDTKLNGDWRNIGCL